MNQAQQLKQVLEQAGECHYIPASNWSLLIFSMKDGSELTVFKYASRIIKIEITQPEAPPNQPADPQSGLEGSTEPPSPKVHQDQAE